MALPPEFLDELRTRLPLSDIVGRRIRLIRAGREHKALCPFHPEKTPSFTLNDDKGFFHCFGCGAHGDVIGFVMRHDGLSFPEAVERLAGEAGMEVPKPTPEAARQAKRMDSLRDVLALAQTWFERNLTSDRAAGARAYLTGRGLDAARCAAFGIGVAASGRNALHVFLTGEGVDEALAIEAGLVRRPDDGRAPYDFFRDRITIPIRDGRGQVIAFGARTLGDQQPKYINSPDSPVFRKGRTLFNLDKARPAARDAGTMIVAEGYMDVIAMHGAGIGHAVAPLGTTITEDQVQMLWKITDEPILCLDGDAAGQRAAGRAADRALPLLAPGKSLKLAFLPPGEDPDSLIQAGRADTLQASLDRAQSLIDFLWRRETEVTRANTPERRAGLRKQLDMLVGRIGDSGVRDLYFAEMRQRFDRAFPRAGAGRMAAGRKPGGSVRAVPGAVPAPVVDRREPVLVATIVNHPALLHRREDEFERMPLRNHGLELLRRGILEIYSATPHIDKDLMQEALREKGLESELSALFRAQFGLRFGQEFVEPTADIDDAEQNWLRWLDDHYRAIETGTSPRRLSRPAM